MQQLVVVAPDGESWTIQLEQTDTIIGREPDLPVVLDSPQVSRKHARLFWLGDSFWVEDLGSSNGVLVDNAPIPAPVRLTMGMTFTIGGFQLSLSPTGEDSLPLFQLAGRSEPCMGKAFGLARGSLDVGRGTNVGVAIEHSSISRRHAVLLVSEDGVNVEDAGSSNGTWINDERVTKAAVNIGDEIRFGSVTFVLEGYRGSVSKIKKVEPTNRRVKMPNQGKRSPAKAMLALLVIATLGVGSYALLRRPTPVKKPGKAGKATVAGNAKPAANPNAEEADAAASAEGDKPAPVPPERKLEEDEAAAVSPSANKSGVKTHRRTTATWLPRWFVRWRDKPAPLGKEELDYEKTLTDLIATAQSQAQSGSWPLAVSNYSAVLRVDPLNDQALEGLDEAEAALETQRVVATAQQAMAQNNPGRALSAVSTMLARGVEDNSLNTLADKARSSIAQHCAADANNNCLARKYPQCQTGAVCALAYQPRDPTGWALLEEAENGMRGKGINYTPYGAATANRAALLAQYPDDKIRDAMLRYAAGDGATATQRLRSLGRKAKAPMAGIATVERAQAAGDTAANGNDIAHAVAAWVDALNADKQLLPAGQPDVTGFSLHRKVGRQLLLQGERAFNRGLYAEAFTAWNQGLSLEPENSDLGDAMDKLESRATRLLEALPVSDSPEAAACERLREVVAITRAQYPAHKDAEARAMKCPGAHPMPAEPAPQ